MHLSVVLGCIISSPFHTDCVILLHPIFFSTTPLFIHTEKCNMVITPHHCVSDVTFLNAGVGCTHNMPSKSYSLVSLFRNYGLPIHTDAHYAVVATSGAITEAYSFWLPNMPQWHSHRWQVATVLHQTGRVKGASDVLGLVEGFGSFNIRPLHPGDHPGLGSQPQQARVLLSSYVSKATIILSL